MNELKLLPVVDDRTELNKLDKVQACGYCPMTRSAWTGPAWWLVNDTSACDACILLIAREHNGEWLLPALVDIADRHQGQMAKLETPIPCELHLLCQEEQRCMGLAHWRASGFAECDEHIVRCLELHPDSRECLTPALEDIRARHLRVGARVRMQYGQLAGKLGTVEEDVEGHPQPWWVRPDDRSNAPIPDHKIALKAEELDIIL